MSGLRGPKPLQVSTNTRLGLKPRPLQLSTNTIHNHPLKKLQPSISERKKTKTKTTDENQVKSLDENHVKPQDENQIKASDENHVKASVENAYDPLKDVYMFDEELYETVCKLELADDGLPVYKCDEPFDF